MVTAELVAGRELDALVAEKVFGWIRRTADTNNEQLVTVPADWTDFSVSRWLGHDINELVPLYSSDIAAAWQIMDRMVQLDFVPNAGADRTARMWYCSIEKWHDRLRDREPLSRYIAHGETVRLAICRAALAALGH